MLDDLRRAGLPLLFITHNLGVVRSLANRPFVMESGRIVNEGATSAVIGHPEHPYTVSLLASPPELTADAQPHDRMPSSALAPY